MHWELSEEQQLFATSLREWIAAKFPTDTVRDLSPSEFTTALVGEGWWGVGYPEDCGGQGGGALELALASREFGRAAVPNSGWLAAALAAPLLTPDELAAQMAGETRFVPAIRADRVPAWGRASDTVMGSIPHVLAADEADVFLIPTADGIARVSATGASVAVRPDNLLDRSRSTATVTFSDAAVLENSAVLDTVEAAPDALARVTNLAAVLVAADALGSAERMLDLAVAYSKQRKQFGQVIGAFQAVKHAAAQMLVTVEAAYSIALYAGAAVEAGLDDAATIAAVAKAQVGKSAAELADAALTVHGAIGYTWEHDLHLFYKRAKLDRTLFGSPSVWNERIATSLLDRDK